MKKLSILLLLFLMLTYSSYQKDTVETIFIIPSEIGYDIYSHDKELLLEYHSTNLDSAGLDLLKDIYEVAIEYKEHPEYYKEEEMENSVKVKKASLF